MILYHYCNVEEFKNILFSKELWLSNLMDLEKAKDKKEIRFTFEHLWNNVKCQLYQCDLDQEIIKDTVNFVDKQFNIELSTNPPFGCCLTNAFDNAELWKEHGDSSNGVLLGFDFCWFSNLRKHMPHPNINLDYAIGYSEVLYHNQKLETDFFNVCYNALMREQQQAWYMEIRPTFKHYSAFIKRSKYSFEKEYRIVYYPDISHTYPRDFLDLTGIIKSPYDHYSLSWTSKKDGCALCIIGLGSKCELDEEGVNKLFRRFGIVGDISIFRSSIP